MIESNRLSIAAGEDEDDNKDVTIQSHAYGPKRTPEGMLFLAWKPFKSPKL
jgi:hypothetical protein